MKKVITLFFVMVLAIGLLLPMASVAANTEGDPLVLTLYADQDIDVGTVSVWDDGSDLHVKYETTGGWVMTETHLEVADSLEGFPLTKKGNPIPGHFTYSADHNPPVTVHQEVIDITKFTAGPELFIAAHAAVEKLSDPIVVTIASGAGTDNVLVIPESTTPDEPVGYPGPYLGTTTLSVSLEGSSNRYSGWPSITGADWISDSSTTVPNNADEWRLFTRTFSLPSNAVNFSGTLQIGKDNALEAVLNGFTVGSDGEVYVAPIDDGEWGTILSFAAAGANLLPGDNTLEIMVRNYDWPDMPSGWQNYTGLIYLFDYEYQLPETETAWAEGDRFVDKGNWATYFEYTMQILTGTWLLDVNGGAYMHDMFIVSQSASGALSGTGGYPASGSPYPGGYDWTLTGQLTGNSVTLVITYANAYTTTLTGTVDSSWNSMGGTGTAGVSTWVATRLP